MMIVQPSPPVQPGKVVDPVVADGVAVAVAVVPGLGVSVAPGDGESVGTAGAVGTAVAAGGTAAVGVGVAWATLSSLPARATISRTTPISASSPSPAVSRIATRQPRGSATSVSAAAPQARHHS